MSVSDILFDESVQRRFLGDVLQEFKTTIDSSTYNSEKFLPLVGTSRVFPTDNPPVRKKNKTCTYFTTTSLVGQDEETTDVPSGFKQACVFYTWLLETPNQNPIHLTWGVMVALYISDSFKDIVCAQTQPAIAKAYLETFDSRFETHLCGLLQHNKKEKTSVLIRQAKTPTEIVLHEWLYVKQLYTTPIHYL